MKRRGYLKVIFICVCVPAILAAGACGVAFGWPGTATSITADRTAAPPSSSSPPDFGQGLVSLTFDDGYASQYTAALPILDAYGIKATFNIITDHIGKNERYMTVGDLQAIRGNGNEIASHSKSHVDLTKLSPEQLTAELADSKAQLEAWGLGPIYDFACPFGTYDDTTTAAVKQYYSSQRTGYENGYNIAATFDPYRVLVKKVINTTTVADLSGWLAEAKAQKAWLVLVYHHIEVGPSEGEDAQYFITEQALEAQVQAIQASGVPAVTVKQALDLPVHTFYFAEGYTGTAFQEFLCLGQPVNAPLDVTVTYLFKDGTFKMEGYRVPALSRFTFYVNGVVGEGMEVSMKCEAAQPFIAERPMYFRYTDGGSPWTGGHDVVGASEASRVWYFAEGYTGTGFDEWICVLNPGDSAAALTFRFQTQEVGEKTVTGRSVAPHSRASFKVNDLLGGAYQTSLALESSQPVVAERPMYFSYSGTRGWGWTGGHCVMGASELASDYFFAEGTTRAGFEEWLTIQNPDSSPITVDAVYMLGTGETIEAEYTVGAARRYTVYVPDEVGSEQDVSVRLTSSAAFLAERPMYFDYQGMGAWGWTGGHCVIGAVTSGEEWFFAEGCTEEGFEEWICIQNPGEEDAEVSITYYPEGGVGIMAKDAFKVAANSRYTVPVNVHAGLGLSLSVEVASSRPVICERPMYFDYHGWCTGGHDVVGYTP